MRGVFEMSIEYLFGICGKYNDFLMTTCKKSAGIDDVLAIILYAPLIFIAIPLLLAFLVVQPKRVLK
jgi:hypothetical protein